MVTQLSSNGDAAVVPLNGVIFYKRLIYQLREFNSPYGNRVLKLLGKGLGQ